MASSSQDSHGRRSARRKQSLREGNRRHAHRNEPRQSTRPVNTGTRSLNILRTLARLFALAIVAFGPWYYGSAGWNAQVVCVVAASLVGLIAFVAAEHRRIVRPTVPHFCLMFCLLLSWLQTVPLPDSLYKSLSPNAVFASRVYDSASMLADLQNANDGDDPAIRTELSAEKLREAAYLSPKSISIYPAHTLASGAVLSSALALLIAGGYLFQSHRWKIGLLITLTVVGIANAVVGLLQTVAWNDWTLLPEFNGKYSFATFINRNSVAQYYSIALGSCLALLVHWYGRRGGTSLEKKYHVRYPAVNLLAKLRRRVEDILTDLDLASILLLLTITLLLAAVLAAASRGGIMACGFALLVALARLLGTKASGARIAVGLTVIGFSAILLLTTLELDDRFETRLGTLSEELHQLSNVRFELWSSILGESQYWLLGSGLGTFHLAVLTVPAIRPDIWFYHAENIYVESFTTLGLPGFMALVLCIGWLLKYLLFARRYRHSLLRMAALIPVVAIGSQSVTDFSLILPAIFLPLALLVGALCGEKQLEEEASASRERESQRTTRKLDAKQKAMLAMKATVGGKDLDDDENFADDHEGDYATEPARVTREAARMGPISSVLPIIAVGVACWLGVPSLLDFAKAEALAKREQLATRDQNSLTVNLAFEQARQKQLSFRDVVQDLPWPDGIDEKRRKILSKPEVFTAALASLQREPTNSAAAFPGLVDFVAQDPRLAPTLAETGQTMFGLIASCPQDWRISWGLLRGDVDLLTPEQRIVNAARLQLVSGHMPKHLRDCGTHFFWSSEPAIGREFWKASLQLKPSADRVFYAATTELFSPEDLAYISPESPFFRISVAQNLLRNEQDEHAAALLRSLDLEQVASAAETSKQNLLVAWLAQRESAPNAQIAALVAASRLDPLNANICFELAKLYDETGDDQKTRTEIERALSRDPSNKTYQDFAAQLGLE
ncbi:MAG: O-antigen ligase family protein [Aureliella sp.]